MNTLASLRVRFFSLVIVALLAGTAFGQTASVSRALNGLPQTDTLNGPGAGTTVIGLRGDAPVHNVAVQAWVGVWEADSDSRRAAQNGVNTNHPALSANFIAGAGGESDFAADGNPIDQNGHGTGVAGIILSTDATNSGIAPKAHGAAGMFDDIARLFYGAGTAQTLNTAADWTQTKAAGDYLNSYPSNIINGSWGTDRKPNPANANASVFITQADLTGANYPTRMVDSYSFNSDRVVVMAAGNDGTTNGGLLTIPGDQYNGITVGALDNIAGAGNNPVRVASYSSNQPLANGRNGVMIVAPGTQITSANWNFATAGQPAFTNIGDGTSFATPLVSGAAADLWSAGAQAIAAGAVTDKGTAFSNDHRLIKAILLNSATKIPGAITGGPAVAAWTPGATSDATHWTHPLNYVVGSGELNTNEAWKTYREMNDTQSGIGVNRWWDEGNVTTATVQIDYISNLYTKFTVPTDKWISSITATLTWDEHVGTDAALTALPLSNLDLSFSESTDGGATWNLLLASVSTNDSTEQIYLPNLGSFGPNALYDLRVINSGLGAGIDSEPYALAVSYFVVPEPSTFVLAVLGAVMLWIVAGRSRSVRRHPNAC